MVFFLGCDVTAHDSNGYVGDSALRCLRQTLDRLEGSLVCDVPQQVGELVVFDWACHGLALLLGKDAHLFLRLFGSRWLPSIVSCSRCVLDMPGVAFSHTKSDVQVSLLSALHKTTSQVVQFCVLSRT